MYRKKENIGACFRGATFCEQHFGLAGYLCLLWVWPLCTWRI